MNNGKSEFRRVHETFRSRIYRYLTRLVGEREAEDLTQEVFVKVSQAIDTFRSDSQLSSWIYRIATNAAIDKIRSISFRQDMHCIPLADENTIEDRNVWTGKSMPSLEQQVLREQRNQCFMNFLNNLPASYRTVLILSEVEEFSDREIARTLGLSLGAVKIRLHRGKERLFKALRSYCKAEEWI